MLVAAMPLLPKVSKVFVPLCGKSLDLHYLAQCYEVVGSELSSIACHDFFAEARVEPTQQFIGEHVLFAKAPISLWQGDFFSLPAEVLAGITLIYDRAALIALPTELRERYVKRLMTTLPSATLLLISVEYPQSEKMGPPFSVSEDEIYRLYQGAHIEKLAETDLTGVGFARRRFATSRLLETSWFIQWGEQ